VLAPDEAGRSIGAMGFSLASEIVELVVLTGDEIFLQTLREAVGGSRRLWHVPSADKVSDLLVAGGVGILVLDAQALNEGASRFIAEIKRQFPDLIVVVAGSREAETALARAISDGTVYRFIHKPMSPGRARLFADAAVRKYAEQCNRNDGVTAVAAMSHRELLIGAACAALCVVLGAIWLLRHATPDERDPQRAVATAPPPPATPLLARAAEALAANRLTAPGDDGALDLYLQALASNPADADARAGLAEVRERLLTRAENALLEERLDEASVAVETARKAGAQDGRLALLSAELAKAREQLRAQPAPVRANAAGSEPAAAPPTADPAEQFAALAVQRMEEGHLTDPDRDNAQFYVQEALRIDPENSAARNVQQALALRLQHADAAERDRLLNSARERLQQDRLIEPANDSAKYYVLTLRGIDPSNAALAPLAQDLGARLVAKGRHSLELQQYDAARSWLQEAASSGYSSADAAAANRDLDTALAQQALLSNVVDASGLTLLRSVRPVYPSKALRSAIEGSVDLEFTIAENGSVRDVKVRGADPPGVFDQAAVGALSQWRYQPVVRGAGPISLRAHVRIRFALER
jgi:TonB family protein